MKSFLALAQLKFQELIREKIFIIAIVLSLVLVLFSLLLGTLTIEERTRVIVNFGLAGVEIALVVCSIFLGAFSFAKDVEKQTCLLILARPVSRTKYLVGQIGGLTLVNLSFLLIIYFVLEVLTGQAYHFSSWFPILLSLAMKCLFLTTFSLAVSLVLKPYAVAMLAFAVYLGGHWLSEVHFFAKQSQNPVMMTLASIFDFIFPHFYRFNWKSFEFLAQGVPSPLLQWMSVHMFLWTAFYLILGVILFRRKQIV